MGKVIIFGIGILILLLALAGTGSAKQIYGNKGADCSFCHVSVVDGDYTLKDNGKYFRDIHKFDSNSVPSNATSCLTCHTDLSAFLPLTSVGSSYNITHRYNETTLAVKMLPSPGCKNCHVDPAANNFARLTGTPTYLTSSVCKDCHKPKYDKWSNTLHAVMLTPKDKAQAMNLPEPEVGWAGISYVIVTKFQFAYINTTGYFLARNDEYDTETQTATNDSYISPDNETFVNSTHAGAAYGTCGRCHTTNWNASARNSSLPGFSGTFSEPGIACERCHKPAGNGHQVVVNYSGNLCTECHTGANHGTGWENGEHAPPPYENGTSCMFCHSSFDQYKNQGATIANASGVSCGVCHNIHDMTDNKYAETFSNGTFNATSWSEVADSKLAFFNATASIAAGTDVFDDLSNRLLYPGNDSSRKDASYGTAPINLTGRPISEVLCSMCHYRHGLAHIAGVNLTHGAPSRPATCTDCHMSGYNATVGKDMMKNHANDPLTSTSCNCHSSVPALIKEWNASAHNDKAVGVPNANTGLRNPNSSWYRSINGTTGVVTINSRANSCLKCHGPMNWDPSIPENNTTSLPLPADFKGITCAVCHNLHDMGDWLAKTKAMFGVSKPYAWYNKDAILTGTRYKANYTIMGSTTELCGNCHSNIRYGNTGPGWASATAANPISPHGFPAKDLFVGSWKESSLMKFECTSCHFAKQTRNYSTGASLPADQRIVGHSWNVNTTILMNGTACSSCHVTGSLLGNLSTTIENIQADTHNRWNTTNATVINTLNTIKAYNGEKNLSRTKIAQAYWNLRLVSSDESWGVHNPIKVKQLLDDASALAIAANASLSQGGSGGVLLPEVAAWDANNDGIIEKSEAITAVVAYFATPPTISKADAIKVVVAYFG